jgi:hypothetical protein
LEAVCSKTNTAYFREAGTEASAEASTCRTEGSTEVSTRRSTEASTEASTCRSTEASTCGTEASTRGTEASTRGTEGSTEASTRDSDHHSSSEGDTYYKENGLWNKESHSQEKWNQNLWKLLWSKLLRRSTVQRSRRTKMSMGCRAQGFT